MRLNRGAFCGLSLTCSVLTCSALTTTLLSSQSANAQTDEQRAGARALAEQGGAAFDEGRWQDAVDLFTRAQSLVDAPPHLLYIARAQEKLGHLVQAMEAYNKVTHMQLASNAPPVFKESQKDAERELQALTPRIPQVTVTVSGAKAEEVVVKVDGEELPSALVGVKRPANPGKHTYEAANATLEAPPVTLAVNEKGEAAVELVLKPKAAAPVVAATPATTSPVQPAAQQPSAPPASPAQDQGSKVNIPAYASLAAGAIGVGVGTFFLIKKSGKSSDADSAADECERTRACDRADVDHISDLDKQAASAGSVSLISYGVGAIGVGVGLALLFMGGDDAAKADAAPISLWASNHELGVAGSF
ncbi:MAG TPA: hypothetical protein VHM70_17975 [Polyangiaceae bacterium]|jgi:hypothetical protein|nr:hypothetical protein [Polyangiaceae bacterium]